MASEPKPSVLRVEGLCAGYPQRRDVLRDISFEIRPGEIVGLAGESGCGKSTLALTLMRLLPAGSRVSGTVQFEGRNLLELGERAMRNVRGRRLAIVWQEPKAALNPVIRCGRQIAEVVHAHEDLRMGECRRRASEMLAQVGLTGRAGEAYPHELSGGQLQRVVLAQALVCGPALVVADEPTASLDTVTQAEIVDLIRNRQQETGTAFLWISHDRRLLSGLAGPLLSLREGRLCI